MLGRMNQEIEKILSRKDIDDLLFKLDWRERLIIMQYYAMAPFQKHTLQEIGNCFGVTRERIRQLRNRGVNKLKKYIEDNASMVLEKEGDKLIIRAVQCNKCGDVIYSRSEEDFRSCSCGHVSVQGGFDHFKVVGEDHDYEITSVELYGVTVHDLYEDWISGVDSYGLDKATCLPFNYECDACGDEALFYGRTKREADENAQRDGWVVSYGDEDDPGCLELCPECFKKGLRR